MKTRNSFPLLRKRGLWGSLSITGFVGKDMMSTCINGAAVEDHTLWKGCSVWHAPCSTECPYLLKDIYYCFKRFISPWYSNAVLRPLLLNESWEYACGLWETFYSVWPFSPTHHGGCLWHVLSEIEHVQPSFSLRATRAGMLWGLGTPWFQNSKLEVIL